MNKYLERLSATKGRYPFTRWAESGLERYTVEACNAFAAIFDRLIQELGELGEAAQEHEKLEVFHTAVLALNMLDERDMSLIETGEREDLCELCNIVASAAGLDAWIVFERFHYCLQAFFSLGVFFAPQFELGGMQHEFRFLIGIFGAGFGLKQGGFCLGVHSGLLVEHRLKEKVVGWVHHRTCCDKMPMDKNKKTHPKRSARPSSCSWLAGGLRLQSFGEIFH